MIRHILLIKFKDSVGHSDIGNVKILFESMVQKIDGVLSVEWGLNDSPEHMNKGFTYSVFMTFANEKGRDNYSTIKFNIARKEPAYCCIFL